MAQITPEQGKILYNTNKRKYEEEIGRTKALTNSYNYNVSQKNKASSSVVENKTAKRNLEKRLEQLVKIISLFDTNVATRYSSANKASISASEKYHEAIRHSSNSPADLEKAFHTSVLEKDYLTSSALTAIIKEKNDVEELIRKIAAEIHQLEQAIEVYNSQIKTCTNSINSSKKAASQYYSNMQQYKKYKDM